jgi:hypothetical protein
MLDAAKLLLGAGLFAAAATAATSSCLKATTLRATLGWMAVAGLAGGATIICAVAAVSIALGAL